MSEEKQTNHHKHHEKQQTLGLDLQECQIFEVSEKEHKTAMHEMFF